MICRLFVYLERKKKHCTELLKIIINNNKNKIKIINSTLLLELICVFHILCIIIKIQCLNIK